MSSTSSKIKIRKRSAAGWEPVPTAPIPKDNKKADGNRLTNGTLLDFQPKHLIKHNLFEPNSETIMAVITYNFHEKDGITLLTGKEELTQPLDKASFDDATAGWKSALDTVKEIAETL